MAGPETHKVALKEVAKVLNIPIKVNWTTATELDLRMTHGYDIPTGEGSLLNRIEFYNKSYLLNDKNDNYYYLRALCHLIVDAHTIGQISKDLWGWRDSLLDAAGDTVHNKLRLYRGNETLCISTGTLLNQVMNTIKMTYNFYHMDALSHWFIFTNQFRTMIRRAIRLGIIYTVKFAKINLSKGYIR